MLYGTQWLRRRHLISFRVGTSIGRKEDMYVSTLVWTNHCLLRAGRRLEKLIHHCVAIWSPWTKVPKQGSAVGSSCPQTTLVSLLIHSLCLCLCGNFVHMTDSYRTCSLFHAIIESLFRSAPPWLSINMEPKYGDTLCSSNMSSPDFLLPVFQFCAFWFLTNQPDT